MVGLNLRQTGRADERLLMLLIYSKLDSRHVVDVIHVLCRLKMITDTQRFLVTSMYRPILMQCSLLLVLYLSLLVLSDSYKSA